MPSNRPPPFKFRIAGIAIRYRLDGPGIVSRWKRDFRTCPDRPWGPPSLLYNGYRVISRVNRPGRGVESPTHLTPRLKKEQNYTSTPTLSHRGLLQGELSPFTFIPNHNPVCASPLNHTCYLPNPSHSSWFYHPNNIWLAVQAITLLFMQLPPLPCHLVSLRTTYLPSAPYSTYVLPSKWKTEFHIRIKQQAKKSPTHQPFTRVLLWKR